MKTLAILNFTVRAVEIEEKIFELKSAVPIGFFKIFTQYALQTL